MFRKILLAFDGSTCSRSALATALSLAKAEGAKLTICTVVDPIQVADKNAPAPPTQGALNAACADAKSVLDEALSEARTEGIEAEAQLMEGEPAYEIDQCAQRVAADAVILGTHGRSGLKRLFLGSVAEETLRNSRVPVIVVHKT